MQHWLMLIVRCGILNYCFDTLHDQVNYMSLHVCPYYRERWRTRRVAPFANVENEDKIIFLKRHQLSVSVQMGPFSFSGAYVNSVVPAILVGLLIVCHPPGAICQGPSVPEPCAEALPRAPASLTPIHCLARLPLSLHALATSARLCLRYWEGIISGVLVQKMPQYEIISIFVCILKATHSQMKYHLVSHYC